MFIQFKTRCPDELSSWKITSASQDRMKKSIQDFSVHLCIYSSENDSHLLPNPSPDINPISSVTVGIQSIQSDFK